MADGMISLSHNLDEDAVVRKIRIIKMRGQAHMSGAHTLRITDDGIRVYPRLLMPLPDTYRTVAAGPGRVPTGVAGLDDMLHGGLPQGHTMLVSGPTGIGKTILGTRFLQAGTEQGEKGIALFFEKHTARLHNAELVAMVQAGQVEVLESLSLSLSVEEMLDQLTEAIERTGATRVVIDSLSEIGLYLAPEFRYDLRLAVSEACTNAVDSQRANGAADPIVVRVEVAPDAVTVTVTDHGGGFDPDAEPNLPEVTDPRRLRHERGLGLPCPDGATKPGDGQVLADLRGRLAALESSTQALTNRIAALETRPAATAPAGEGGKAALAIAIGALRQAAASGGAFDHDLAMLEVLGVSGSAVTDLKPLAAKAAPKKSELIEAFPGVADHILASVADASGGTGFLGTVGAFAKSFVSVRPAGPIACDTPEAIVSRMRDAVDHGDFGKALAERDALPQVGQEASAAWAQAAADRAAIDRLVDIVATTATPAPAASQ